MKRLVASMELAGRNNGFSLRRYRSTLQTDRRHALEGYNFADMAHKVVGIGSVGLRAWIILLLGRDDQDPLFLQAKEAQASALEPFLGKSEYPNSGQRVVAGQRLMQAASDVFLGWYRAQGADGIERDFHVRQLRDWKLSVDIAALDRDLLGRQVFSAPGALRVATRPFAQ